MTVIRAADIPRQSRRGMSTRTRKKSWLWIRRTLGALIGLGFVFPFYWVFVISTDRPGQFDSYPPVLIPEWDWSSWAHAWSEWPWLGLFANTIFIACSCVILCLITSTLAGFAFGVLRFPGRKALMALVLSVLMMPQTVLIIPDYVLGNDIHWINTYWIQIVPWGASVIGIFLVKAFFESMPREVLDAAAVDGAGRMRILLRIGVPAIRPALVIVAINVFMGSWNSFLWPEVMTRSAPSGAGVQPIEVGLAGFSAANGTDIPGLAAATAFTTLPLILVFLLLQRQFIRGALSAAGAFK
jgi:multiple sugar transport system permease protein